MSQDENIQELKAILESESPVLFLGAGFSVGATNKNGESVPTGSTLKERIIKEFLRFSDGSQDYNELYNTSLDKVCKYAHQTQSKNKFNDFLSEIFSGCTPAPHHYHLRSYTWRKIYTTNIDDVVEKIYKDENLFVQNLTRKKHYQGNAGTEYIKLHGCVNNSSGGYIFSAEEYLESMVRTTDYRFSTLNIDINFDSFVFVGTSFEEINIDYYLKLYENQGNESSRGKLFFITPNPKLTFKANVQSLNGKIIQWTSEEFLKFLKDNCKRGPELAQLKQQLRIFGFQNYTEIRSAFMGISGYRSNLYLGAIPKWEDILFDWDFINPEIIRELKKAEKLLDRSSIGMFSIFGKSYVGKSCFLHRYAAELYRDGYEVFYYSGRYFNPLILVEYIKKNPTKDKFALLVDNGSFYYRTLKFLLGFSLNGKKLLVISTSRPFYHSRKRYYLIEKNFLEFQVEPKISREYSKNIIGKLSEKGFLGSLTQLKSEEQRIGYFEGKDVLNALYGINLGEKFRERLSKEILPLFTSGDPEAEFLTDLAVFEKMDLPYFPKELVGILYGEKSRKIFEKVDEFIKIIDRDKIAIRAEVLTDIVLKKATKKSVIQSLLDTLKLISPQIGNEEESYWWVIFEALAKVKQLSKNLHLSKQEIFSLLNDLHGYYYQYSYYWVQLAISEQELDMFDHALNHFVQAESIAPESSLIKHAIGRHHCRHANHLNNEYSAKTKFEIGEKILVGLIERYSEYQIRAFATHSLVHEKVSFYKKFNVVADDTDLRRLFLFLQNVIDKDPGDTLARRVAFRYFEYLKSIGKQNILALPKHKMDFYFRTAGDYSDDDIDSGE